MSDLLKESIADAKAVRESALANAKTFLEENFAASMKEMFAEKLKEEMATETMDSEEEGVDPLGKSPSGKSSKIGGDDGLTAKTQKPVKPSTAASKNTTPAGKQEFDVKLDETATEEAACPKCGKSGCGCEEGKDEEITSEELDEILAELEGEVGEGYDDGEVPHKDEPEGHGMDSDVKGQDEEINLDELLAELEADGAEAPAPEAQPAAPAPEAQVAPAPEAQPAAPAPEAQVAQVPSPEEEGVTHEEMAEALVAINEENEKLKKQLAEAIKTVKYMKSVLSETNLLNAKLLYTNKLFKGKTLTEDQKLKIINAFDLTKNIREVKIAYTLLAESLNSGASVVKKKTNTTAQSITEGLASKPTSSTKPDSTIVEPHADEMASRFQKLAGIKK